MQSRCEQNFSPISQIFSLLEIRLALGPVRRIFPIRISHVTDKIFSSPDHFCSDKIQKSIIEFKIVFPHSVSRPNKIEGKIED